MIKKLRSLRMVLVVALLMVGRSEPVTTWICVARQLSSRLCLGYSDRRRNSLEYRPCIQAESDTVYQSPDF